jgi:hypothetical protein
MPPNWPTYAWYSTAAILGLVGACLLIKWLIGDRSKGRRRCPRCWYDMSGTPGLTCPECGTTVKAEHRLFQNRRRRSRLAVSAMLLLAASAIIGFQYSRKAGWTSLIPTPALVFLVHPDSVNVKNTTPTPSTLPGALYKRWNAGTLTEWESQLLMRRHKHYLVRSRKHWPEGVPVAVEVVPVWTGRTRPETFQIRPDGRQWVDRPSRKDTDGFMSVEFVENHVPWYMVSVVGKIQDVDPSVRSLNFDAQIRTGAQDDASTSIAWSGKVSIPVRIGGTIHDLIKPDANATTTSAVQSALKLRIERMEGQTLLRIDVATPAGFEHTAIAVIGELTDGTTTISTPALLITQRRARLRPGVWTHYCPFDSSLPNNVDPALWTLRVRGDAVESLNDFTADHYWSGSFSVPLSDVFVETSPAN